MRKISSEHKKALEDIDRIKKEIGQFIFGLSTFTNNLLLAFFSRIPYDDGRRKRLGCAHPLIMSPPGYGKTGTARILASTISGKYTFIGGHPEMKISEILGFDFYHQPSGSFIFIKGPIFANIVLTDEINRIHPKAQGFNLQAMEERMVVVNTVNVQEKRIDNTTYRLTPISDDPNEDKLIYFNMATGNPIENEGTYSIPEAQLDRFSVLLGINVPDPREEMKIRLENVYGDDVSAPKVETVMDLARADEIARLAVYTVKMKDDDAMSHNIMRLIQNSRPHGIYEDRDTGELVYSKRESAIPGLKKYVDDYVKAGLSPRSNFHFQAIVRTRAFMQGRNYVTVEDIKYAAKLVMPHRILLRREARARGIKQYDVVNEILKSTSLLPTL